MIRELVLKCRSYRGFHENHTIDLETVRDLVDLARMTASAANLQPLKYIISCTPEKNATVFQHLAWAGYLKDWGGPQEGERPSAYVVILGDTQISASFGVDPGIAAQTILLGAVEKGLGGCMFGSIDRDGLRKTLHIPDCYEIVLVVALGKPKEKVVLETLGPDGDIKYYRDADGVHHVPKRPLDDIILG